MSPDDGPTFCERHQMSTGESGCPGCRHEEARLRASRRGPAGWGVAALALALFGGWVLMRERTSDDSVAARLDAETFRPTLETIEGALYAPGGLDGGRGRTLQDALHKLAAEVRATPDSAARLWATEELEPFLSTMAVQAGYPETFDIAAARRSWERQRGAHFTEAAWFRHGVPPRRMDAPAEGR
jgi:hypothetical protein